MKLTNRLLETLIDLNPAFISTETLYELIQSLLPCLALEKTGGLTFEQFHLFYNTLAYGNVFRQNPQTHFLIDQTKFCRVWFRLIRELLVLKCKNNAQQLDDVWLPVATSELACDFVCQFLSTATNKLNKDVLQVLFHLENGCELNWLLYEIYLTFELISGNCDYVLDRLIISLFYF